MAVTHSLGEKVRSIRESRSMTGEQLAERADLAPELVAQIESGSLIPSLSPLIRIARALGVRLGTFLDDEEHVGPVVSRVGEHERVVRFSGRDRPSHSDLDFFSLAANKAGRHMEPFLIDVSPASPGSLALSSHEGEEFVYVLSGEIEIEYGKDLHVIGAGDSIYYDSIVPHQLRAHGAAPARILAVVYTPA